jgi:acyl-CoA thioester hydrolase
MNALPITYRGAVYPWQCDHMGHMNVQWYVEKFDEACWHLLAQLGLSGARLRREGLAMAAVEQRLEYKRELHAGDAVTIRSRVLDVTDKSIRMRHELRLDETSQVAATTEIVAVHLDAATRKARSLPDDVRTHALTMIRDNGASPAADQSRDGIQVYAIGDNGRGDSTSQEPARPARQGRGNLR